MDRRAKRGKGERKKQRRRSALDSPSFCRDGVWFGWKMLTIRKINPNASELPLTRILGVYRTSFVESGPVDEPVIAGRNEGRRRRASARARPLSVFPRSFQL